MLPSMLNAERKKDRWAAILAFLSWAHVAATAPKRL